MPARRVPSLLVLVAPVRQRYFAGRLLTADDFRQEQEYHINARRRLNLALLGAGVVWGLNVSASGDGSGVEVSPGVAIDGHGREIIVPCAQVVALDNHGPRRVALLLGYREELIEPILALGNGDNGGREEPSRVREAFRLWCAPARKVRGESTDPEREAAVVLAMLRLTAAGRLAARGVEAMGKRKA